MAHINHFELLKDLIRSRPCYIALDIGTGQGKSALPLIELFPRVVAIDSCADCILNGRKLLYPYRKRLRLKIMDGAVLRFPEATFDCVTSYWSFHHYRYLNRILQEIYRVLQPGGLFFGVDHLDQAGNQKQNNYLELHKLKIEVERALGKDHFDLILPEAMIKTLKKIGFIDIGFELFLSGNRELKLPKNPFPQEDLLTRIKSMASQLKASIELVSSKRDEYSNRLAKILERIERIGVEHQPYYAVYGRKPLAE
uniref:Class I SAM-dependent methyltransferase n=1 Tax=candidate division WOR-3 bacterium TaxID=2052148 RepID=A0A7C6A859_UNCW3